MWQWLRLPRRQQSAPGGESGNSRAGPRLASPVDLAVAEADDGIAANAAGTESIAWLIGVLVAADAAMRTAEHAAVARIDALLADNRHTTQLLPRAPAVIPQLLGALRQRDPSLNVLVERVSKDIVLIAEVMRMAGSAHYAGDVGSLSRAVATLGESGLRVAISRVLLRPLLQVQGGVLSQSAGQRLWDYAEQKAHWCGLRAPAWQLDPFDAYMAGLMHAAGWILALRAIDGCALLQHAWSGEFIEALIVRRDLIFGRVTMDWQVSPAITRLAHEAIDPGLRREGSKLAKLLLASDGAVVSEMLHAAASHAPQRGLAVVE